MSMVNISLAALGLGLVSFWVYDNYKVSVYKAKLVSKKIEELKPIDCKNYLTNLNQGEQTKYNLALRESRIRDLTYSSPYPLLTKYFELSLLDAVSRKDRGDMAEAAIANYQFEEQLSALETVDCNDATSPEAMSRCREVKAKLADFLNVKEKVLLDEMNVRLLASFGLPIGWNSSKK